MSAIPSSSPKNIKISFITHLSTHILGLGGVKTLSGPSAAASIGSLSVDCNSTRHAGLLPKCCAGLISVKR